MRLYGNINIVTRYLLTITSNQNKVTKIQKSNKKRLTSNQERVII